MTIDKSRKWWVGDSGQDLREYLISYASTGFEVTEFRLAQCHCGSSTFSLSADDSEGVAERVCAVCKHYHFICDSEDFWSEANPEKFVCVECGCDTCNVAAGFSLYEDGEVRWIYVGERCAQCGTLGCFAGWKVGYSPSKQLLGQV